MEMKQNYFIVLDTTEGAFLGLHPEDSHLLTYSSANLAHEACDLGYKQNHENINTSWSTSAALRWMNLKPFVVALDATLTAIETLIILSNSNTPELEVYSLSKDALRRVRGIKVDLETCRNYQTSPLELINPAWQLTQPVTAS